MNEYIKKKDVLNGLSGWAFSVMPSAMADTLLEAADAIERMPTADVHELKRGKWIDIDTVDGGYQTCSCCKQDVEPNLDGVFFYYPFCPYCGAEMEVEE